MQSPIILNAIALTPTVYILTFSVSSTDSQARVKSKRIPIFIIVLSSLLRYQFNSTLKGFLIYTCKITCKRNVTDFKNFDQIKTLILYP